jgi:hypothetical protein
MCIACPEGFILNEDSMSCVCPKERQYLTMNNTCISCKTMWLVKERICVTCDEDKVWNETRKSCICKSENPILTENNKCVKCENGTIWS